MKTAEEYIKEQWCDPIWEEWNKGDVIDVLEEYSQQQACAFLDWYFDTYVDKKNCPYDTSELYQQFLTQSDNGNK